MLEVGKKGLKKCRMMMKCHFKVPTRNPDGSISISDGSRIKRNRGDGSQRCLVKRKRVVAKIKPFSEITEGRVVLDLPLQTVSEANCSEHWTKKHKRHEAQKEMITIFLRQHRDKIKLPCHIKFTRFAPMELDQDDNLPMSFKYINDYVCAIITGNYIAGRADGDKRISRTFDQVKSQAYGIRIDITF